jgi:hypothetical protein
MVDVLNVEIEKEAFAILDCSCVVAHFDWILLIGMESVKILVVVFFSFFD